MTDQDRKSITARIRQKAQIARFEGMALRISQDEDSKPGPNMEDSVSVSYTVSDRSEIPGR